MDLNTRHWVLSRSLYWAAIAGKSYLSGFSTLAETQQWKDKTSLSRDSIVEGKSLITLVETQQLKGRTLLPYWHLAGSWNKVIRFTPGGWFNFY